jgi:uncharacterized protein YcgI (DUF1989 family)
MATITRDTLDWYGWDEDGAGVHDVIGTRCDPYTNLLLKGTEYHHCWHSNLTRALATERNLSLDEAEVQVHDVMNVFMCTGYTRDTHQYFMKASPVRPSDFIEFFAEIDLLVALSACPGAQSGISLLSLEIVNRLTFTLSAGAPFPGGHCSRWRIHLRRRCLPKDQGAA